MYSINVCSNEVYDQIESAILTRDIYSLCELQSPGFCTGVCSIGVNNTISFMFVLFRQIHQNILIMLNNVLELGTHSLRMILV